MQRDFTHTYSNTHTHTPVTTSTNLNVPTNCRVERESEIERIQRESVCETDSEGGSRWKTVCLCVYVCV